MSSMIKSDLRMAAFRRMTGQRLTISLKKISLDRCKVLLGRYTNGLHRKQDSSPAHKVSTQLSSGCKRTFQSSSLPRIGPQEALISTRLSTLVRTGEDGMPQSTP
ncbi:unnamed protein product [Nezara viridula]|uniref:Uncharacterized protein n=1 Tax=Nezara viridula TaxID=85310 RepID=A0A9P0HSI2_NEZVI|nr:unnamed protein product [Nezara viridula]